MLFAYYFVICYQKKTKNAFINYTTRDENGTDLPVVKMYNGDYKVYFSDKKYHQNI